MYAKLFSRITESSLMEEEIPVRYTFVMLLAISDLTGHVIGTDVAIARRLNMPLPEFMRCIGELMEPDPDSNSKEEDGRRLIPSTGERGYKIVNFITYRNLKDEEEKRLYMREYMRRRRGGKVALTDVNFCKTQLSDVTQAEAEAEAEASTPIVPEGDVAVKVEEIYKAYPLKVGKKAALRAIKAALKEIDACDLLTKTLLYASMRGSDLDYCPHPATWFNRGSYNDDPETWSRKHLSEPKRNDSFSATMRQSGTFNP